MTRRFVAVLAAVMVAGAGALLPSAGARAEETAAPVAPRVPVTAGNVEQKSKFVGNLINNSASARAIEASDDAEAKEALKTARGLSEEANRLFANGDLVGADEKLKQATELMIAQTRKVSLGSAKDAQAKRLYESRLSTVKALAEAYQRVSKEKGTSNRDDRHAAMADQIAEAEAMAAKGNYEAAVVQLDKAYTTSSTDVAALRDGDKLRKDLNFASPEEEYTYEIDRNDSHQFLIKLTLSEKPPHEMYADQIATLRSESEELRKVAEAKGKAREYQEAIKVLGESTQRLIKALRMAGAYIPG
ncbi:MAG: hypothetical protein ABT940_11360 [Alphaproteobacteria bacterium]